MLRCLQCKDAESPIKFAQEVKFAAQAFLSCTECPKVLIQLLAARGFQGPFRFWLNWAVQGWRRTGRWICLWRGAFVLPTFLSGLIWCHWICGDTLVAINRVLDFGLGAFIPIAQWFNDLDLEAGTVTPITFLGAFCWFIHLNIMFRCLYSWSADHGNLFYPSFASWKPVIVMGFRTLCSQMGVFLVCFRSCDVHDEFFTGLASFSQTRDRSLTPPLPAWTCPWPFRRMSRRGNQWTVRFLLTVADVPSVLREICQDHGLSHFWCSDCSTLNFLSQ